MGVTDGYVWLVRERANEELMGTQERVTETRVKVLCEGV